MPELPEVETIRRDLADEILNHQITKVEVRKPKLIKGNSAKAFIKHLTKLHFLSIDRIGKLLIFNLSDGNFMLVHLKMTGQLIYQHHGHLIAGGHTLSKEEDNFVLPNKYTHVIWHFKGHSNLYFNDLRQFGYLKIVDLSEKEQIVAKFGFEPLNKAFTGAKLAKLLQKKKRSNIKAALLDQSLIAGIGNIYADEACHLAKIRPARRVSSLKKVEIDRLAQAIKDVLRKSIEYRGTTFNDYRDAKGRKGNFVSQLKVYGRGGEECKTCHQAKIIKIKHAGRGTHYCPHCQK